MHGRFDRTSTQQWSATAEAAPRSTCRSGGCIDSRGRRRHTVVGGLPITRLSGSRDVSSRQVCEA
eukprot:2176558-Prymnesium_polylepis.1